jgi:hypothetical protein
MGMWSKSGARNTILDSAMIAEGKAREKIIWAGGGIKTIAALDPAFTTDGDDCILRFAKIGKADDNQVMIELTDIVRLNLMDDPNYPLFYQVADQTISELEKRAVRPEDFALDATGAGAGIADIISQRWQNGFMRVTFGGAATDAAISVEDPRPAKQVYSNRVTQLWSQIKVVVMAGRMRGMDDQTARELCARIYSLKNEKTLLASKKDLKKRTKGSSPDRADALSLLVELFVNQNGLGNATASQSQNFEDWDQIVLENSIDPSYQ